MFKRQACQFAILITCGWAVQPCAQAEPPASKSSSPQFRKLTLTDQYYCDGIDAADIDNDGSVDVVAGPYWYSGPDFKTARAFYEPKPLDPAASPSNSMFSFARDFNRDNRIDILVLGRVHKHAAYWYENEGKFDRQWPKHFVCERVRGESPSLQTLVEGHSPSLLTHWDGRWGYLKSHPTKPQRPWQFVPVGENKDWPQFYHGEGWGDINGDGRIDILINDGWYEHPKDPNQLWTLHPTRFSKERGGAQMFAYDVDADGDNDVISSIHAHYWGLSWFEQVQDDGKIQFQEHRIMGSRNEIDKFGVAFSQPHALQLADIDGDGLQDIVCGKRRWAHGPKGDIEPNAAPVVYWFQLVREKGNIRFVPHLIDDQSGVGTQICVKDVNADKRPDVLTASKLGTFVFLNQIDRSAQTRPQP